VINEPWPHMEIDNYYDETLMNNCIREILALVKKDRNEFKVSAHRVFVSTHNLYANPKFPETNRMLRTRDAEDILKEFPVHREHSSLYKYGECILCLGDSSHPIHDEAEDKVLSVVTYLWPETGEGTLLYNKDKSFSKQVEWKPNRAMAFAGTTGLTWHSYKSTTGLRLTLNTFLMR
jgi:hypothetical protein